jgi:protein polybromo-1
MLQVVSNPMDMLRIQQKIKMDEYDDLEQMSADVDLMVTNAKAFYKVRCTVRALYTDNVML